MTEFTKEKIAFAVGLLAVLFTITPLLEPFGAIGFKLFDVAFTLIRLYYFLTVILALAVYAYAFQFLTQRDLRYPSRVGDLLYALAIVTPLFYFALLAVDRSSSYLGRPKPLWYELAVQILSFAGGLASALATRILQRRLSRATDLSQAKRHGAEAASLSQVAKQYLSLDGFNEAALSAWSAMVSATNRAVLERGGSRRNTRSDVVLTIERYGLLPTDLLEDVTSAQRIRNSAGNPSQPITKEQAEFAVSTAERVIKMLDAYAAPS